jgi:hypothetical protein
MTTGTAGQPVYFRQGEGRCRSATVSPHRRGDDAPGNTALLLPDAVLFDFPFCFGNIRIEVIKSAVSLFIVFSI